MRLSTFGGGRLLSSLALTLLLVSTTACRSDSPAVTATTVPEAVGTTAPTTAYDSPIGPGSPIATPANQAVWDSGRRYSALESLPAATRYAEHWNPEAMWVAIFPTTMVSSNLGLPLGAEGWFFKFELPNSPVEYFVHVEDGEVTGASEAQPLIEPPFDLLPLDTSTLQIDSNAVLSLFLSSERGKGYVTAGQSHEWEYRLVRLDGMDNPVWSLFNPGDLSTPLINVDATTGEIVEDPFS